MAEACPHDGSVPWLVGWRATHTPDPIERLRYLRAAGAGAVAETLGPEADRRRRRPAGRVVMAAGTLLLLFTNVGRIASHHTRKPDARRTTRSMGGPAASVWLVERSEEYDVYSNGLRIDGKYMVTTRPRRYRALDRGVGPSPVAIERTNPAGIVYHTTESHLAPFSESHSAALRRAGMSLIEYVRHHRAYHFVIDRFGRVFGVVRETDVAGHAGHSVWADERSIYLGLNASFLGVAFEARTPEANPAQIHSARILTEMLRSKYRIAASNCVTHAQVSVNPVNRRMGYHTDWAAGFPFAELGLPDNYRQTPASLALFGFAYDDHLVRAAGGEAWAGLAVGQGELERQARAAAMPLGRYRATLQQRYREARAAIEPAPAP